MSKSNVDNRVVLYWNNQTGDVTIEGQPGAITPEEAKTLWDSCLVKDCNAGFNRFVANDFDSKKAIASYDE